MFRKLRGDLTTVCKYLKKICGKDGANFFYKMDSERTEYSGPNYQQGKS